MNYSQKPNNIQKKCLKQEMTICKKDLIKMNRTNKTIKIINKKKKHLKNLIPKLSKVLILIQMNIKDLLMLIE